MSSPEYKPCWYCLHYGYAHAPSGVVRCRHPTYPMNCTQPERGCSSYAMVPDIAPIPWAPGGFLMPDGTCSEMWTAG